MELSCIIIDDEPRAIEVLKEYVEKVKSLRLLATFRSGVKALEFINNNDVNLIFIDINMPNLSGIQFIKSLTHKPQIVLTTAYSEYAVESYQLDVTDYLLKPIEFDRFMKSISKVFNKLGEVRTFVSQSLNNGEEGGNTRNYIFVKNGTKLDRIDFNSILYIEGSGNYISYILASSKILVLGKMTDALEILPDDRFVRIHKSYIVQINKIDAVKDNHVIIGDSRLSISNTYRGKFYEMIDSGTKK